MSETVSISKTIFIKIFLMNVNLMKFFFVFAAVFFNGSSDLLFLWRRSDFFLSFIPRDRGQQQHDEEMSHSDHDWHFINNQILSVLKVVRLQVHHQEQ